MDENLLKKFAEYVLVSFILTSCIFIGMVIPRPTELPVVDKRLAPLLDEFVGEAAKHGILVNPDSIGVLVFHDLPARYAGLTYSAGNFWDTLGLQKHIIIVIDPIYEDTVGTFGLKALVFHELGHALLGKNHDMPLGYTIMAAEPSSDFTEEFIKKTWEKQLDWLFYDGPGVTPTRDELLK